MKSNFIQNFDKEYKHQTQYFLKESEKSEMNNII